MSQEPSHGGEESWEALLRSMLGEQGAAEAMSAMRASGLDPEAMAQAAGLPQDSSQLSMMMAQVQQLMAASGEGGVNWDLARDVARQVVAQAGDPTVSAAQAKEVHQALQVADLWLDAATSLAPAGGQQQALARAEWVTRTLETFQGLAEPVALSAVQALEDVVAQHTEGEGAEHLHPMAAQLSQAGGMIRQLGGAVMGMQLGQAVGTLATEVFGTTDTGVPLIDGNDVALLPSNVEAFAEGLDVPIDELRHFLAVREAAHARLFANVGWLGSRLLGAVEAYSREIAIDTDAMTEAVRELDPSDSESLREAFAGGIFAMEQTDAQRAALRRLETLLALVEGWVEEVTHAAVAPHLPHAVSLREMLRRRRAAGGPAEQTFAGLVGLELRPRRIREAAQLWASLAKQRGTEAREDLWAHPDLVPTSEELDDPTGFVTAREQVGAEEEDVDAALAALLGEPGGDEPGGGEPGESTGSDPGEPTSGEPGEPSAEVDEDPASESGNETDPGGEQN